MTLPQDRGPALLCNCFDTMQSFVNRTTHRHSDGQVMVFLFARQLLILSILNIQRHSFSAWSPHTLIHNLLLALPELDSLKP